jgi:hypothetical protein
MDIRTVYERMNGAGLVRSQIQFSSIWLGKSDRYYSHLLATGRQPSLATLYALLIRLKRIADDLPNAGQAKQTVNELAVALSEHLRKRAVFDNHRRRQTFISSTPALSGPTSP